MVIAEEHFIKLLLKGAGGRDFTTVLAIDKRDNYNAYC